MPTEDVDLNMTATPIPGGVDFVYNPVERSTGRAWSWHKRLTSRDVPNKAELNHKAERVGHAGLRITITRVDCKPPQQIALALLRPIEPQASIKVEEGESDRPQG